MSSIGEYLHSLRTENKITLEEISKLTKIKIRLLKQIEENKFDGLGGTGYAKALIFNYGKALSANEKKLEHLFNKQFSTESKFVSRFQTEQPKKIMLPGNIFGIIALIIVVIILSFITYHIYKEGYVNIPFQKKVELNEKKIQKKHKKKTEQEVYHSEENSNEKAESSNSVIDKKSLRDTTDYMNQFLFKNKKSPLNISE